MPENSPVHQFEFPIGNVPMWMVTRYDDVRELLGDSRFSSDGGSWAGAEFRAAGLVIAAGTLLEKRKITDPELIKLAHTIAECCPTEAVVVTETKEAE